MQNTFDLTLPEQELLKNILTELEVRTAEELAVMKAEGDRIIAKAFSQKDQLAILHRRVGHRERIEDFLHHAHAIRETPAVHRSVMQTKISANFVGELELRTANTDVEVAFRNEISAVAPFFHEIITAEDDGCFIVRAVADLFELVAFTETLIAEV